MIREDEGDIGLTYFHESVSLPSFFISLSFHRDLDILGRVVAAVPGGGGVQKLMCLGKLIVLCVETALKLWQGVFPIGVFSGCVRSSFIFS